MLNRLLNAWRERRKRTLTTRFVGRSEYLSAVDEAFREIISAHSLELAEHEYSDRSFGNFVVRFTSPVFELRVVRDRGCCGFEMRPLGSKSEEDWVAAGFLLQLLGHEATGNAINSSTSMTLADLVATAGPYFDEIARLFEPSNASNTYRRLDGVYARTR